MRVAKGSRNKFKISEIFPPLVPLLLVIVSAEVLVQSEWLPAYLVPAPSQVARALFEDSLELWSAFSETFFSALLAFVVSAFLGLAIGILFSSVRSIQKAFYPYAIFFQTVPIVAVAPLLVIWFGYGLPTIMMSALIVSIFPMIASTLTGLSLTDSNLLDLFRLHRASKWTTLWKLKFPSALPEIFIGLRISAGLAVIGAIVGEFITGGGLGGVIDVARTRQRVDQVFAAVLLATLIGLLFVGGVNLLRRFYLRRWALGE